MPFSTLGLCPALVRAVSERGYLAPTAIQSAAIPAILQGQDVLGSADTGSGKTAAFVLPLLQRFHDTPRERPRQARVLMLVPTRELAAQIGESVRTLAQHMSEPVKVSVVFGGVSINPQMMGLRGGTDIVVATPGRLLDLVDHNALKLSQVATLVLDEADRLIDLGFAEELSRILALLPIQRQNLLFSATLPPAIQGLAHDMLQAPVRIDVPSELQTQPDITQRAIEVDANRRTQLLRHLIQQHAWERTLVFVATKFATEIVADKLRKAGIDAEPFHGQLSQGKRTQVLADFKASHIQVVVATDVAARGIDIAQLPVVVNYDLPRSADDYTHRIGRTGRAGASGLAVNFISADTEAHFRLIEKRQHIHVAREQIAGFEPTAVPASPGNSPHAPGNGGIKGKRPSKKDKLRQAAARQ
ncbi:MAG: DEAD/DEAH box helicase [Gammaproteobacteria bacterium]|nr:DEAD/DEAH box helicase [Gammaproteobacteria bacterium]MBU0787798.1 DEAD/DEAH box helicase [Gammaproteobacteria bacterium]MBU0817083.1 DEAD/DEAH box helicase [Gammaproteobacteria bacterium]MBU1787247.1 DEAD/DEAH box helicase [Gammaproteobacteria bacterium]